MRSVILRYVNIPLIVGLILTNLVMTCTATGETFDGQPLSRSTAREAAKQVREGDKLYDQGGIKKIEAIAYYKKALTVYPGDPLLHFRIGEAYLEAILPDSAIFHLSKVIESNTPPAKAYFLLAEARAINHEFDKAIEMYRIFRQSLTPQELSEWRDMIEKKLLECQNGKTIIKQPARAFVDLLDNQINSSYDDYNPLISPHDGLIYFTSRRPTGTRDRVDSRDHKYTEKIFIAKHSEGQLIQEAEVAQQFNTRSHSATAGISHDGNTLVIYRGDTGGNLLFSQFKKGKWTKPREIRRINSRHHETSATFSSDGNTMYFISERPGGYGGKDIWVTTMGNRGRWTEPVNLGPVVNTEYDEEGLYLAPDDKTLYFSSKGHNSMGGYDIFSTTFDNGRWSNPVNLGYPVNTSSDDVFFKMTKDGKHAYLSSNRPDGSGSFNLYHITFPGPEKPVLSQPDGNLIADYVRPLFKELLDTEKTPIAHMTLLYGTITDEETGDPLDATITLYDNEEDLILAEFINNPETGEYFISLPGGKNYGMAVQSDDYLFYSVNMDISQTDVYRELINNIKLKKIDIGKAIVLNNIFFDFDRATLRPESYAELGILYKLLEDNPRLKVEVSGHTDDSGTASYNERLSEGRARAVVTFLIERGIDANRLTYKGYGSSRPVASNDTEEGRQLNRRTEFEIVDY